MQISCLIFQQGLNNSSWFAFSNTGDTQTGNVNDNKGIVTIDLGGQAEITGTSINLFAGANDAGSGAANIYDRGPSGANIKPVNSYSWTKTNVPAGQTWVAKAYVQYKTQEGKLITVYSDLVEAIKE